MSQPFVHLHLHTEYSIVDGLIRIPELLCKSVELGLPAVAVTDHVNLFSMVKFYRAALAAGIKPIIGTEIYLFNPKKQQLPFRLILLCQNKVGYKNLTRLISRAYLEGQTHGKPIIEYDWLENQTDGLIALSAGQQGDIGQALLKEKHDRAKERLERWLRLFPNRFYLEVQRVGKPREEDYIHDILELAAEYRAPVVATNDARFIHQSDYEAHEARICINGGWQLNDSRRPHDYTDQQYYRSAQEMTELFSDMPEALENTVEIAKRCNLTLTLDKPFLPNFPVPEGISLSDYFSKAAKAGLEKRVKNLLLDPSVKPRDDGEEKPRDDGGLEKRKLYDERLERELGVINQMGFAGYFLIVADFVRWAKENDVPVGPGRGSGAGSLVAYALGITDPDPLQFDLLFERFLNPERVSMPDFDIDFCMDGRDRVIDYVAQKYGRQSVSQIITYGTMAAKAVVRDVGRVLGHPYGFVDKLAKLIPFELGMTLDLALEREEVLAERYKKEAEVKNLIDLARRLEGLVRNAGKHAGGVVISPSLLTDFAPLYCEAGGNNLVTQFDKYDVEAIGLVKFDFLGLRTLTIIHWAVQTINEQLKAQGKPSLDISLIPTDDTATFDLLKSCQTTAVFQLESRGMKDLIKRLVPDCFEEIVALVALYRPGPLQSGMVDDFINRKHGHASIEYLEKRLEPILRPTYGVILYQEQVMQIAQVLAGYSLGGADILRKAMGKKNPKEMAKQRKIFVKGAVENGVREVVATRIFDLMEKFAGYGFNKSHSVAYALIAYQTAWLKAHYPAEFMAAVLSSDMDNTDKVVRFIEECRAMKLDLLSPNINQSQHRFVVSDGKIVHGLGAIKGVGEAAIESIIAARKEDGDFCDFFDFCRRIDLRKANRRVLEALIKSGAMDAMGSSRASMIASIQKATLAAEQYLRNHTFGQNDLFAEADGGHYVPEFKIVKSWSDKERLQAEKETLGFYVSGHPLDQYEAELKHIVTSNIKNLKADKSRTVVISGLIAAIRTMNTKRGDRMAFVALHDKSGRIETAVFSDIYTRYKELLQKDQLLVVEGDVNVDDYTGGFRFSANNIMSIDQAREIYAKYLLLRVRTEAGSNPFVDKLANVLTPYLGGKCSICLDYQHQGAKALLPLGKAWRVHPRDELIMEIKENFPSVWVEAVY